MREHPHCGHLSFQWFYFVKPAANPFSIGSDSFDMTAMELQLEPVPTYEKPAVNTDGALIAAAISGAEPAFRELFRRHTPHLLQFVTRVLGVNRADAEDVVQDTWLRAYPALVTFRSESSFSTWLCSVGLRAALDSMRKGKRHVAESLFEDDASSDPPPTEDRMDIESAIARLAPGYRMVLVLHDVEGFTHEEIALQLGIAPGTSKAQLFKARRVMRALLTGREKTDVQ
jgi:RNA polymerase sigma-70 factor (ECF subfamily)